MRPSAGVDLQVCSQRVELDTIIIDTANVTILAVKNEKDRLSIEESPPKNLMVRLSERIVACYHQLELNVRVDVMENPGKIVCSRSQVAFWNFT
jgi:hypothetical protein